MKTGNITSIDLSIKSELNRFLTLERTLMSKYPLFVSELDVDVKKLITKKLEISKNMDFGLFVVSKSGVDVGRCAAIISRTYQEQKLPNSGFIGFFAAADNCEAEITELIHHAEMWLKDRGVTKVIAPSNGGAPNAMGFLVSGYEEDPMFPFQWSPPYYNQYIESLNYKPTYPLWYYNVDFSSAVYKSAKEKYKNYNGASIRSFTKKTWDRDIETMVHLLNETFINEWEFAKISLTAMKEFMGPMKDAIALEQFLIAEVDGEPAGFCFAVPDLTPLFRTFNGKIGLKALFKLLTGATKKFNRAGILGIGVTDKHKGKGLAKAIAIKIYGYHESLGLKSSLYFPVNESNMASRKFAESIGGTGRLMYQVYDKEL